MGLLDTKEYTVATVLAAQAAGSITDARYWNYATGQVQTTPPSNIPLGQAVGACFYGSNSGSYQQSMYFVLTLKRPDGTVRKTVTTIAVAVPSGATIVSDIITEVADQAGSWKAEAKLYGDVI